MSLTRFKYICVASIILDACWYVFLSMVILIVLFSRQRQFQLPYPSGRYGGINSYYVLCIVRIGNIESQSSFGNIFTRRNKRSALLFCCISGTAWFVHGPKQTIRLMYLGAKVQRRCWTLDYLYTFVNYIAHPLGGEFRQRSWRKNHSQSNSTRTIRRLGRSIYSLCMVQWIISLKHVRNLASF